jgi:hypothetical protein
MPQAANTRTSIVEAVIEKGPVAKDGRRSTVCPFVDTTDARCAAHLTLKEVVRAFAHCADRYRECPVFHRLVADRCFSHESMEEPADLLLVS